MAENYLIVQKGVRILQPLLAGYIAQQMSLSYGKDWWQEVLITLQDQIDDLPGAGDYGKLVDSLDFANCLRLFDRKWSEIFKKKLSVDYRTWAKELMGVRNKLAHIGGEDFSDADAWRALDTMARLCSGIDPEGVEELNALLRESRYGSAAGSAKTTNVPVEPPAEKAAKNAGILQASPQGLPSWRTIMEPHPDVAQGLYRNAEFAADLSQVARGEGSIEYRDPVEFFQRTYVTEGMRGLLVQALRRVSGKDGEPVIQLKTAFGGGKTHSMLALFHVMRGMVSVEKIPNIKPVLAEAGLAALPKVNVAVIVGTAIDPTKARRPQNMPGITINTIWGEIAAQLSASSGNLKLYDYIREADRKGVAPGSTALKNLFDACGPCMVLIDELVAYAKTIYGVSDLPAGSFDNFISFIQQLTEAARASKNSLVVASIPESEIEIGGDAGKIALETIEHTFGRMESIWKPVNANEGFEVVRRRLFLNCKNPDERDRVCSAFSRLYAENAADFPLESKEVEYRERMIACYPIHPEIFDRLYEDWATLERFQRTRGVLRLMAAVIHELWMGNDAGAMIMPGSVPMDVPNVREELTRYLPEGWNAIVDREVDGKNSVPYQKDQSTPRYGQKLAARRVARTIMLGSAPTSASQTVRGLEASRIRLGVVQPGENIADFNDALNTLQVSLAYLYSNPSADRFWYDTRPTLRKTAQDRATQIASSDVEFEIERRLRALRREEPFAGLHICPASSLDVQDDQAVRLVILRTDETYKANDENNAALKAAKAILDTRGNAPRIYKNMLAFVAPDQELMTALKQGVREYLAWLSIKNDSEDLNLDAAQNRETANNLKRNNDTVDSRILETYCWLIVPCIDKNVDMKTINWERIRISGGSEGIVSKAAKKMIQNEALITKWAPALLLMELDALLWKDSDTVTVKKLWEYLTTYCYLPRLANFAVLEDSIRTGVNSTEYFGLAAGTSEGRYLDLQFNQLVTTISNSDCLVKQVNALKQLAAEKLVKGEVPTGGKEPGGDSGEPGGGRNSPGGTDTGGQGGLNFPEPPRNRHFYLSADLDTTRINRDVQKLVEEVISHLSSVDGAKVNVTLEVNVDAPDGMPVTTVRTVSENCQTLKVKNFGFDQ